MPVESKRGDYTSFLWNGGHLVLDSRLMIFVQIWEGTAPLRRGHRLLLAEHAQLSEIIKFEVVIGTKNTKKIP